MNSITLIHNVSNAGSSLESFLELSHLCKRSWASSSGFDFPIVSVFRERCLLTSLVSWSGEHRCNSFIKVLLDLKMNLVHGHTQSLRDEVFKIKVVWGVQGMGG